MRNGRRTLVGVVAALLALVVAGGSGADGADGTTPIDGGPAAAEEGSGVDFLADAPQVPELLHTTSSAAEVCSHATRLTVPFFGTV